MKTGSRLIDSLYRKNPFSLNLDFSQYIAIRICIEGSCRKEFLDFHREFKICQFIHKVFESLVEY